MINNMIEWVLFILWLIILVPIYILANILAIIFLYALDIAPNKPVAVLLTMSLLASSAIHILLDCINGVNKARRLKKILNKRLEVM